MIDNNANIVNFVRYEKPEYSHIIANYNLITIWYVVCRAITNICFCYNFC